MNGVRLLVLSTSCFVIACSNGASPPSSLAPPAVLSDRAIPSVSVSPGDRTADPSVLVLHIESADSTGPGGRIRYRLRNNSPGPLWVNARMLLGSVDGEVSIQVAESSVGKPLDTNCRVRASLPQYVLLAPQSEISVVKPLGCVQFPNEGPWRLTARYQDRSTRLPPPPSGARWFNGIVVSNELEFYAKPTQVPPAP